MKNIKTEAHPYWECADGSTITPGSVVVAETDGIDHAWIYMGEFDSRNEVVSYLKGIGVSENLITSSTVGIGNGDGGTHWRIESNGSQGVVIPATIIWRQTPLRAWSSTIMCLLTATTLQTRLAECC